jgi:hypothetical protein
MYMASLRTFLDGLFTCARPVLLIGAYLLAQGLFNQSAAGATLAALLNGASIDVGNSRFVDWELISLGSTATANPDLSQILVTPLVNDLSNPGVQFLANGQLEVAGINSIDLEFKFRLDAAPGGKTFTNHALTLTDIPLGTPGGLAEITDEISGSSGDGLDPAIVFSHMGAIFALPSNFTPQSTLFVTTNVFLNGSSAADALNVDEFTLRFSQSGPAFLPADFDEDDIVDGADLAIWKAGVGAAGAAVHSQGDADGDHDVDGADFLTWQQQLGSSTLVASANVSVPEPATSMLVVAAAVGIHRLGGRTRRELIAA